MLDERKSHFRWLERLLGIEVANFIRWMLFIPSGLVSGIVLSTWFALLFGSSDSDNMWVAFLIFGVAGGCCSVIVGLTIAPRYPKIVCVIMAAMCVALAVATICWARVSQDNEFKLITVIIGSIYSFGAVMTALAVVQHFNRKKT